MNITETLKKVSGRQNKKGPASFPKRILVIDDEEMVLRNIGAYVKQLGYEEEIYSNPEEALARFLKAPRDYILIIVDLRMPGLSGKNVLMKAREALPDIPVILLTYSDERLSNEEIDRLKIQMVLIKPFALETLAEAIAASRSITKCVSEKELPC